MMAQVLEIPQSLGVIDDDIFAELCRKNPEARIERSSKGKLIIMAPTGGETGKRNSALLALIWNWNKKTDWGVVFDSSTAFKLPDGSIRSPDVAFIKKERWEALSPAEKRRFPPLCPDFVIELLSDSDSLAEAETKMADWMSNGCQLGWLIDTEGGRALIYRAEKAVATIVDRNESVSSADVLPGFTLKLADLD